MKKIEMQNDVNIRLVITIAEGPRCISSCALSFLLGMTIVGGLPLLFSLLSRERGRICR